MIYALGGRVTLLVVHRVQKHERSQAETLEKLNHDEGHRLSKFVADSASTLIKLIDKEASDVRDAEADRYDSIPASFCLQTVGDFAILPH